MPKRTSPYTVDILNRMVEQFRATQVQRVRNYRRKTHTPGEKKSTRVNQWDLPLTVCSCGTKKTPFIAQNGRNCSALRTPHPVLAAAYNNIVDGKGNKIGSIQLGSKANAEIKNILHLSGQSSYDAGRCAEPHAANRVLKEIDKRPGHFTAISDLLFSVALDARYPIVKPYCVTCKCVFPQLR